MRNLVCYVKIKNDEQKKREKYLFDNLFQAKAKDFDIKKWIQCDHPDCLCLSEEEKVIGIEAFDYIRGKRNRKGSIERKNEKDDFGISEKIEAFLKSRFKGPMFGTVKYQDNLSKVIKKKKMTPKGICQKICKIIEVNIPKIKDHSFELSPDEICELEIDDYVSYLSISIDPNLPEIVSFDHHIAGFVGFDFESFRNQIHEKEERLNEYLKQCDECWIIGFAYGPYISSTVHILSIDQNEINSKFKRVFLVNSPTEYKEFKNTG